MKRPDLSDLLLLVGIGLALHAVYAWSPALAQLLAGLTLAVGGVVVGVLKSNQSSKKRSQ